MNVNELIKRREKLKKELENLRKQFKEMENTIPGTENDYKQLRGFIDYSNSEFTKGYDNILSKLEKNIKSLENELNIFLKDYDYLPNSTATKFIKNISISQSNTKSTKIPVNKNVKISRTPNLETGQTRFEYLATKENYSIIFEDLNAMKSRQSISFRKTLNFILIKANEQSIPKNIYFDLEEYKESTGYKNKDTAYKGAVRNFETLRGLSIGGTIKKGKQEIRNKTSYIFIAKDISYNQCFIECKPEIVEMLSQYFTILPKWAGELNTKAYDLLDYIFYMARQTQNINNIRKNNKFNISLEAINNYIGGHDPTTTTRHGQLIIDPILNAIEEIEETQKGEKLKITPIYNYNYNNVYEFLEGGYIQVELGKEATKYFCDRSKDRGKKLQRCTKKKELPTS